MLSIFSFAFCDYLYVFLREMPIKVFCPFLDWVGFVIFVELYELFIYILEIKSLLTASFANNLSHSIGCRFIFLWFLLLYKSFCLSKSHNGILLSHKKNEIMSLAAAWIQLEILILSEVSQKEKGKYCTYIWNPQYGTNELIQKIDSQT